MTTGSCHCEAIKYSFTGEPVLKVSLISISFKLPCPYDLKALCHCDNCKHSTGSLFSTNIVIPDPSFSFTGTPKEYKKKSVASGNTVTDFFCGNCGTTVWSEFPGSVPGTKLVKAGTLDRKEDLEKANPAIEFFAPKRAGWLPKLSGTELKEKFVS
jgi:hypothetical protein